jgi:hypothetical protein
LKSFENRYITDQLFNGKSYLQLAKIKIDFPVFWQELISNKALISLCIRELEKTHLNNMDAKKIELLSTFLDWNRLITDPTNQIFLTKNTAPNLLKLAARYQPEAVKPLLESIAQLNQELITQILLQKDMNGYHALMLTAQYQPTAVKQPLPVSRYSHEKFWPSCPQN